MTCMISGATTATHPMPMACDVLKSERNCVELRSRPSAERLRVAQRWAGTTAMLVQLRTQWCICRTLSGSQLVRPPWHSDDQS